MEKERAEAQLLNYPYFKRPKYFSSEYLVISTHLQITCSCRPQKKEKRKKESGPYRKNELTKSKNKKYRNTLYFRDTNRADLGTRGVPYLPFYLSSGPTELILILFLARTYYIIWDGSG